MRCLAFAMPLPALPLAAAACGGSKGGSSSNAALPDDPGAAVEGAARKTVQAGSEHVQIAGRVVASGQIVTFTGAGSFDTRKHVGALNGNVSAGALNGAIEEVSSGTVAYVKSEILTGTGRYDVWIGEDGYVHRVKAIVTTSGVTSTLTTELSAFGESVSVDVPKAADTFDGTNASIPGLGG